MKYIAIHHTASLNTGSKQLLAVNRYHQGKWNMISDYGWYVGYNYFCDVDGTRTNTRRVGEETIANRGHNCDAPERCDTISYCLAGDFRTQKPTAKQEEDLRSFVAKTRLEYPSIIVVGHRDLQEGRTCPELPHDYIQSFNRDLDHEDKEKSKEIAALQRRLDSLLILLKSILLKLKSK